MHHLQHKLYDPLANCFSSGKPMTRQFIFCIFLMAFSFYAGTVNAQLVHKSKQDSNSTQAQIDNAQEGDMLNEVRGRDQQAINSAVNGWWTASMENHDQRVSWWRAAKFGMFLHWGVYSLPGGEWKGQPVKGYAEHLMRIKKIPRSAYLELAHHFNPVDFDADTWVQQAKKAGMRYLIITAKHHDGFAMFNSRVSDYNIVQQTPFHKDPMVALSAACKKYGLKFGFYYSHAFDWEDPNAPGNDWDYHNPGGDLKIGGEKWFDHHPEWLPRIQKYVNHKAIPQIRELIEQYHPDILWFDTPHKLPLSENIRILKAIRTLDTAAAIVVNGRLARTACRNFGDYQNTADRPVEFYPVKGDWEAIPTTNESYGYSKYDVAHKPASHFIRLLAKAVSRGGNLLMNIGPMGNGRFDPKDIEILNGIGAWMEKNDSSIYGTTRSPLPLQSWGVVTAKRDKIFLHVFQWPEDGQLYVGGLQSAVKSAYMLTDPSKNLQVNRVNQTDIQLSLPTQGQAPGTDTVNRVIVLTLKDARVGEPGFEADSIRYISTNIPVSRLLAYDASQHGGKFSFGDGKANRYYLSGWKSKDQYLEWTFRTGFPTDINILVKYVADAACGGSYQLTLDDYQIEHKIERDPKAKFNADQGGQLHLPAGVHHLKLKAKDITATELMKLLEIQLRPK